MMESRPSLLPAARPALSVSGLRKSFGRTTVLHDVSFDVPVHERHAVIGPNGAGKSTLFHLVSGFLAPDAGSIQVAGQRLEGWSAPKIACAGVGRSFQLNSHFARMTVLANLQVACLRWSGVGSAVWPRVSRIAGIEERCEELMESVSLQARRDQPAGLLSYAEQRALEIAMTLAPDPALVLLDEPTAGMSREETTRAIETIRRLTRGRTLVMIEHDMEVVFGLADAVTVLAEGRVLATGSPQSVRANAEVQAAYLGALHAGTSL
jgi:branched-chain amino acid transport system ATP-binding protein